MGSTPHCTVRKEQESQNYEILFVQIAMCKLLRIQMAFGKRGPPNEILQSLCKYEYAHLAVRAPSLQDLHNNTSLDSPSARACIVSRALAGEEENFARKKLCTFCGWGRWLPLRHPKQQRVHHHVFSPLHSFHPSMLAAFGARVGWFCVTRPILFLALGQRKNISHAKLLQVLRTTIYLYYLYSVVITREPAIVIEANTSKR
jgi:hypothetical protein